MRAIILCAGKGSRLHHFSSLQHKALLPINGLPLIESNIQYLQSKNIMDITLVLGHHAEKFEYLIDKYNISTRISTVYETHNNYTSMQLVLDKMEDCLVTEADLYFKEDFVPLIDTTKNQYFAQNITHGKEWGFTLDSDNRILSVDPNATQGIAMIGASYWTGEYTEQLTRELNKCTQNEYWDDANFRMLDTHPIYADVVKENSFLEFDSLEDILFYKAMDNDTIASMCSDNGHVQKINHNTYHITKEFCLQELVIHADTVSLQKI